MWSEVADEIALNYARVINVLIWTVKKSWLIILLIGFGFSTWSKIAHNLPAKNDAAQTGLMNRLTGNLYAMFKLESVLQEVALIYLLFGIYGFKRRVQQ